MKKIWWYFEFENIRNLKKDCEKTSQKYWISFRLSKNVNRFKKFLGNIFEISKKYWKILHVLVNFEDIVSNFRETSDKREILEKTWKYLIKNELRLWKNCDDFLETLKNFEEVKEFLNKFVQNFSNISKKWRNKVIFTEIFYRGSLMLMFWTSFLVFGIGHLYLVGR